MKKLIMFILITAIAFGQCADFVKVAEDRLLPPYPNYFGAAGEYVHAADCYYAKGEISNSIYYYKQGADDYVLAAEQLVKGGDQYQRAKSYELAADAYLKANFDSKAVEFYSKAEVEYRNNGYFLESEIVQKKISALTKTNDGALLGLIGLISLIALFFSFLALIFIITTNEEMKEKFAKIKTQKKTEPGIVRRSSEQFKSPVKREEPVVRERISSAREKAVQKLRQKYMPK